MIRDWKTRVARRWLKQYLAGELDDNCSMAGNFGYDREYPGVWFGFSAHTCPSKNCRHKH